MSYSLLWNEVEAVDGKRPPGRFAQASSQIGSSGVIIHGGCSWKKGTKFTFLDDLWFMRISSPNEIQWEPLSQRGQIPGNRAYHHICAIGRKLYLFGGKVSPDDKTATRGIHVYDYMARSWYRLHLECEEEPASLGCSASVVDQQVFVFGGMTRGCVSAKTRIFQPASSSWSLLETSGAVPPARCDHAAGVVNSSLYIHGGCASVDLYLSDLYELDTNTLEWTRLDHGSPHNIPRAGHTLTAHHSKDLYVFGGYNDLIYPDGGPVTDEICKFSINQSRWKAPKAVPAEPFPENTYDHSAFIIHSHLYIIGGLGLDGMSNDVQQVRLLSPSERQGETIISESDAGIYNNVYDHPLTPSEQAKRRHPSVDSKRKSKTNEKQKEILRLSTIPKSQVSGKSRESSKPSCTSSIQSDNVQQQLRNEFNNQPLSASFEPPTESKEPKVYSAQSLQLAGREKETEHVFGVADKQSPTTPLSPSFHGDIGQPGPLEMKKVPYEHDPREGSSKSTRKDEADLSIIESEERDRANFETVTPTLQETPLLTPTNEERAKSVKSDSIIETSVDRDDTTVNLKSSPRASISTLSRQKPVTDAHELVGDDGVFQDAIEKPDDDEDEQMFMQKDGSLERDDTLTSDLIKEEEIESGKIPSTDVSISLSSPAKPGIADELPIEESPVLSAKNSPVSAEIPRQTHSSSDNDSTSGSDRNDDTLVEKNVNSSESDSDTSGRRNSNEKDDPSEPLRAGIKSPTFGDAPDVQGGFDTGNANLTESNDSAQKSPDADQRLSTDEARRSLDNEPEIVAERATIAESHPLIKEVGQSEPSMSTGKDAREVIDHSPEPITEPEEEKVTMNNLTVSQVKDGDKEDTDSDNEEDEDSEDESDTDQSLSSSSSASGAHWAIDSDDDEFGFEIQPRNAAPESVDQPGENEVGTNASQVQASDSTPLNSEPEQEASVVKETSAAFKKAAMEDEEVYEVLETPLDIDNGNDDEDSTSSEDLLNAAERQQLEMLQGDLTKEKRES